MKVDYLIVGQGIAGSLLAYELLQVGESVFVLNEEKENTSSNKAAGIYNPITGRKMVKTWLADELFENLEDYYQKIEAELSVNFLHSKSIYRPFFNYEEQNDWSVKASDPAYESYVQEVYPKSAGFAGVIDPVGGLMLRKSGYVNIPVMVKALRGLFLNENIYRAEVFSKDDLKLGSKVTYRDIEAKKVIFCEGPDAANNPYWSELPFRLVKGEILQIDTALPEGMILNRSVFVLPKNGHFHVGSTYDHQNLDYNPSPSGIKNLRDRLSKIYEGDYTMIAETAGVRPATYDRRPFIGFHSEFPQVGIFNGFGTKGVSLAPYFASQFVNYLIGKSTLMAEVDIRRVFQ